MTKAELEKMWSAFGVIPTNSDDETSHAQTLNTQNKVSRRVPCDL